MSHDMVIVTPENAEIRVPLAGVFSRAGAFVYDLLLQLFLFFLLHIVFLMFVDNLPLNPAIQWLRHTGIFTGFYLVLSFLWVIGYHVYFEVYNHGRTPGKSAFSIRVVMNNGQNLRFFNSFLRTILRVADFLPMLFISGLLSSVITENQQRIGDLLANTVVIRDDHG